MPAPVEIYTRAMCGYCYRAVRLLQDKGADFVEHDAGMDAAKKREMVQRAGGASTFPQIFIGGDHVGGCDDMLALERRGALDAMLKEAGAT
ncbi:glutaredoxin 3 [Glycocaulis profundi]|nr:glutaredoxin 3 [Glycocaulis profundi]